MFGPILIELWLARFSLVSHVVLNLRSEMSLVEPVGKDKKSLIRFGLHNFQARNRKKGHEQAFEEGLDKDQNH